MSPTTSTKETDAATTSSTTTVTMDPIQDNAKATKSTKVPKAAKPNPKQEAIDSALAQIHKQYGEGSIMKMGKANIKNIATTPSGSLSLDLALGGGIPEGRIIEIFGPESSGKTTLSLHAIAEVQKSGGKAAFIDAEHALDIVYAKKLVSM